MLVELLLLLLTVGVYVIYRYLSTRKKYNLPPGPKGYPLIGNLFQVGGRVDQPFMKWSRTYGEMCYCELGRMRAVFLNSAKLVREVFNDPVFSGRSDQMMTMILSNGKHGILMTDGEVWQEQRRFTLRHLRDFGFGKNRMEALIMEEVNEFISWLKTQETASISMEHKFELSVLNSLWRITTGTRIKPDDQKSLEMFKKIDAAFVKPNIAGMVMMLAPKLLKLFPEALGLNKAKRTAAEFHEMCRKIIAEHEKNLPDPEHPRDFIDAYLHEIKRTTDEKSSFYKEAGMNSLTAIVGDVFFAGSETTSTTLNWAMLYLAMHPDIQKKFQAEIDHMVGKSRQVSLTDRLNLPYAEATMLEIFRKSSITAAGVMHTCHEDAKIHGYDIPVGTWIMPNIVAIHNDPKTWGDPENFRPERFLSDDGKTVKKNENLLPFSLGKRQCIGENLARDSVFLFTTNIFQRFSVQLDPSRPKPTMEPKDGFLLCPKEYFLIMKDRMD